MLEKHNGRYFRNGAEITAGEYAGILADTKAKAQWVDRVCAGTASAQDVPEQWREEIIQRAAGRQALIILRPDDEERARQTLSACGVRMLTQEEVESL